MTRASLRSKRKTSKKKMTVKRIRKSVKKNTGSKKHDPVHGGGDQFEKLYPEETVEVAKNAKNPNIVQKQLDRIKTRIEKLITGLWSLFLSTSKINYEKLKSCDWLNNNNKDSQQDKANYIKVIAFYSNLRNAIVNKKSSGVSSNIKKWLQRVKESQSTLDKKQHDHNTRSVEALTNILNCVEQTIVTKDSKYDEIDEFTCYNVHDIPFVVKQIEEKMTKFQGSSHFYQQWIDYLDDNDATDHFRNGYVVGHYNLYQKALESIGLFDDDTNKSSSKNRRCSKPTEYQATMIEGMKSYIRECPQLFPGYLKITDSVSQQKIKQNR